MIESNKIIVKTLHKTQNPRKFGKADNDLFGKRKKWIKLLIS